MERALIAAVAVTIFLAPAVTLLVVGAVWAGERAAKRWKGGKGW